MHPDLSDSKTRFFQLLQDPLLKQFEHCWEFDTARGRILLDKIDCNLGNTSSGETYFLNFLLAVWFGQSFDIIGTTGSLDENGRKIVSKWFFILIIHKLKG